MKPDETDTYIRYLTAKKSVDDRALNAQVWQTLKASLPPGSRKEQLDVMDIGAGTGAMFERVLSWGLSPHLRYTMIDVNPEYLAAFTSIQARGSPFSSHTFEWRSPTRAVFHSADGQAAVDVVCTDLYDVISNPEYHRRWDLIIAHAVMDLVNIDEVLDGFEQLVKTGGLLYLTLNYDGFTGFLPRFDADFEHLLFERYHRSMDQRIINNRPSGSSQCGRKLCAALTKRHWPILATGSSDWIVYPTTQGYLDSDATFLKTILHTIFQQLHHDDQLDPHRLTTWLTHRLDQVNAAALIFMARNIDFLVQVPVR